MAELTDLLGEASRKLRLEITALGIEEDFLTITSPVVRSRLVDHVGECTKWRLILVALSPISSA